MAQLKSALTAIQWVWYARYHLLPAPELAEAAPVLAVVQVHAEVVDQSRRGRNTPSSLLLLNIASLEGYNKTMTNIDICKV